MSEHEEPKGNVVELLLREPEIVAWLEDYRPRPAGSAGGKAADARPKNRVASGDPGDAPDDDEPAAA